MRYLLMIYEEPPASPLSQADWNATMGEYRGYNDWLRETGQYLGGEALQPVSDATTVSVRDGRRIVTDGPFAETKEHLGGYYLIDAVDLDAALDAAARMPGARTGKVEIRPILELG
jgi:hypothetical protein